MEFLVHQYPDLAGLPDERVAEIKTAERAYATRLRAAGHLVRLWRLPGTKDSVALYDAPDATVLHEVLMGLPSAPWMRFDIEPLATHPQEQAPVAGEGIPPVSSPSSKEAS